MSDNINQLLMNILKKQDILTKTIEEYKLHFGDSTKFARLIGNLEDGQLYSSEIVSLIADSLQMLESTEHIEQFELQDILNLYKTVLTNNRSNAGFFKDYILFKINVLGETDDAALELTEYIKLLDGQKQELKEILSSLR